MGECCDHMQTTMAPQGEETPRGYIINVNNLLGFYLVSCVNVQHFLVDAASIIR